MKMNEIGYYLKRLLEKSFNSAVNATAIKAFRKFKKWTFGFEKLHNLKSGFVFLFGCDVPDK